MDYNRAKEILNSENNFEVLLNGQSVWLNNIDPRKQTAQITNRDNLALEVDLTALEEGQGLS